MARDVPSRELITARDVDRVPRGSELRVRPGTIVTPWARDRAAVRGVRLVEGAGEPPGPTPGPAPGLGGGAAAGEPGASSASCSGSSCSCGGTCSKAPAAGAPAAWISPFANRILRGPDTAILLGIERPANAASAY